MISFILILISIHLALYLITHSSYSDKMLYYYLNYLNCYCLNCLNIDNYYSIYFLMVILMVVMGL